MTDGHIEYFAMLARILQLAGITSAEADQHLWQAGTWPAPAEMWSTGALELRSQLSRRVIELVELRWVDRTKPEELMATLQDLRGLDPGPAYSADDIAVLKDLVPVRRRPDHHIVVDPIELSVDESDSVKKDDKP